MSPEPVLRAGAGASDPCPCGSGKTFGNCCQALLDGGAVASAEALMRSRYTAFALGDEDHLFRSWWPRTRPEGPYCHPGTRWTGLEVEEVHGGGSEAADGEEARVTFTAHFLTSDLNGRVVADQMRECSTFRKRAGRWFYVDGQAL